MKKLSFLLVFIFSFSFSAFAQVSNYDYRAGMQTQKKRAFKAPIIRIGTLTDTSFIAPVIIKPTVLTVLDTQAIYVVTLEVDSAYVLTEIDSVESNINVDTIQEIGGKVYTSNLDKSIDDSDDNWETIQDYLANSESTLDTINEETVSLPDTQVFYVLTEKIDSVVVINNPLDLEETVMLDSMSVDTFYQVGAKIFKDDLASSIEEEDWKIIKEELLRDSVINISTEDLSYEEYLDIELDKEQLLIEEEVIIETPDVDPVVIEKKAESVEELEKVEANLKQGRDTIINITEIKIAELDTISKKEIIEVVEVDVIDKTAVVKRDTNFEKVNARLSGIEEKLEALRANQTQTLDEEPVTIAPIEIPAAPSKELIELQKKIETLEAQTQQKTQELEKEEGQVQVQNSTDLEEMRRELALLKEQRAEEKRIDENDRLKAEVESLRRDLRRSQERVEAPVVQVVPNQNTQEMNQLRTEVASVNKNMEMVQQLLLQQQVIEALKKEPKTTKVVEVKDTTNNAEIIALRKEVAALKASMSSTEKTTVVEVAVPVEKDNGEVDTLRQQILNLQQELKAMKDVKPAEPIEKVVIVEKPVEKIVEVQVEKPVVVPVNVMDLIKGKEKKIVFFNSGSSKLTSEATGNVGAIAQLMLQYEELQVVLEAYTDSSGDPAKNLLLSKKRAESVKASIMKYGISGSRIFLDFRGEDGQSDTDPAFGRRVEMILRTR